MTHFCSVKTILFAVLLLYVDFRLSEALSQLSGDVIWAVYPVVGKLMYAVVKGQAYCCPNDIEIANIIWISSPHCTQVTNTKNKNMWNYQMVIYRCATLFGRSFDIYSKILPSLLSVLFKGEPLLSSILSSELVSVCGLWRFSSKWGSPRSFGEQANKDIYFGGTRGQRSKNEGNSGTKAILGLGKYRKSSFRFMGIGEQSNFISRKQGNRDPHWEGLLRQYCPTSKGFNQTRLEKSFSYHLRNRLQTEEAFKVPPPSHTHTPAQMM